MKMFLFGFAVAYFIGSLCVFLEEEYDLSFLTWYFIKPWAALMIILMFVPVCVIRLFRCVVIPVELKSVNELRKNGMKDYHLFGSFYFCHDKDARSIANRNFFFRIKEEDDHA